MAMAQHLSFENGRKLSGFVGANPSSSPNPNPTTINYIDESSAPCTCTCV